MEDAERRSTKRSRFDQTEPEPRRSRFDRRSRSPPTRRSEARDRSPYRRDEDAEPKKPAVDAAAAAAEAAARINAQLQARKGIQHVDVPPIQSSSSTPSKPDTPSNADSSQGPSLQKEMYVANGDYIQDIEVNDLKNRYLITKASTQQMINDETGADVTTRGSFYPNKALATAANPPLYLHVTSTTKEGLEKAVAKINEIIQGELPQLVDDRRFRRREQEPVERDELGRRKWRVEKVPIDLESVPGFNLRAQVVGHGGSHVKYIQQETGCRVQIKGRGSSYLEAATNRESDEDMYLSVTGPDSDMIDKAKGLCEDLIANVREQYEEFKSRPPRQHGGHGGYGGHGSHGGHSNHGNHGGYGDHGRGSSHGGGSYSSYGGRYGNDSGASNSPAPPGVNSPSTATADYAAQYAQYYGGADPYAAWGGYANYVALYQQYYGNQAQQAQAPGQTTPGAPGQSASPPPPPSEAAPPPPPPPSSAPPPPPPSGSPGGGYSAVPPPPGL